MTDDTNQRARECLAKAAEQFGCKEVPIALRGGDIALINSDIALVALTSARDEALREAAEKLQERADAIEAANKLPGVSGAIAVAVNEDAAFVLSLITGGEPHE